MGGIIDLRRMVGCKEETKQATQTYTSDYVRRWLQLSILHPLSPRWKVLIFITFIIVPILEFAAAVSREVWRTSCILLPVMLLRCELVGSRNIRVE